MKPLAILALLAGPLHADPFVETWVTACIADGARAFGGARGALPPGEQRLRVPAGYCHDRAAEICRFAPAPAACLAALDAAASPGDNGAEGDQR